MNFTILGFGTAVPAVAFNQAQALRIAETLCNPTAEQATWLPTMYGNTGIERRHMVLADELLDDVLNHTRHSQSVFLPTGEPNDAGPTTAQRMQHYVKHAGPLAIEAAGKSLENAKTAPRELTHLVTVSCTGFHTPGVDIELIHALGLPATIQRTHIGFMGCHGALNGLRVARAFAGAEANARVLLCATELCSLHYYYGWNAQKMIANALFADGSAALVGGCIADAPHGAWRVVASGSYVFPATADAMTWSIGDHGFEMTLAKKVPGLIAEHLRPWIIGWLADLGLTLEKIATWAIHPGGPRILDAVEHALSLRVDQSATSRAVFAEYGNMSSPTILFILDRLRRDRAELPCVALGFGPGLTVEAALLR